VVGFNDIIADTRIRLFWKAFGLNIVVYILGGRLTECLRWERYV
jgi:hypothetical protein